MNFPKKSLKVKKDSVSIKSHPNIKNERNDDDDDVVQNGLKESESFNPSIKKSFKKDTVSYKSLSHPNKKEIERKNQDEPNYSLDLAYQYLSGDKQISTISEEDGCCKHTNTINKDNMTICIDCGENIEDDFCDEAEWRYYGSGDNVEASDPSRCQYRKVVEKGITKELLSMGFSVDVAEKANELYLLITKGDIKRSNYRKGIMFACIFHSFIHIGKPQTTEYIREIFKITKRNVSKGFTYYGLEMPKEKRDKYVYITAEHYIPKILSELNVKDEHINNVLALYNKIKDKSYILNTSNPQSIGSGFVYYYLKKLNIDVNPSKFGKIVNLSEITISRIANEIQDIINTEDN